MTVLATWGLLIAVITLAWIAAWAPARRQRRRWEAQRDRDRQALKAATDAELRFCETDWLADAGIDVSDLFDRSSGRPACPAWPETNGSR